MVLGSEAIARVRVDPGGDIVRVHHTYKNSNGDYAIAIHDVKIRVTPTISLTLLASNTLVPSAGRSYVGATSIEPDGLESGSTARLLYWYQINTTASGNNYGPARVYYSWSSAFSRDTQVRCLTIRSDGTCDSWPKFSTEGNAYGDYQKGAFWFDGTDLNFMALWGEEVVNAASWTVTNIVKLRP